jgi:alpha-amylase/alpha-mannosidase (GH57 family)
MRSVCIHGHFYQPPRENPSLEYVELQDSAYPYHDWNERITAECYAPNATSRIMDADGRIAKIVNNYSKISFDFGPTLLSWLQENATDVYHSVIEADVESRKVFSGHGSALAQAYNHVIMPLANRRDKRTQVIWGLRDFEHRFGRKPEGTWLPETAVDLETLDLLAEFGIKFTILAPRQASRVRRVGSRSWKDVSGDRVDPNRPYLHRLPSRRKIALFFYDGPISRAVAFEGLLDNGEQFANRLLSGFPDQRGGPELVHIATDGESYGHHHHFGEMALSYALEHIESNGLAEITNYAAFLDKYPPTHQVEIFENSSWSCVHGVERWRNHCGCNSGGHDDWNQKWRFPLRSALDWLRDSLAPRYEEKARPFLKDPWEARDDYVGVMLDRAPDNMERFLRQHTHGKLSAADEITVWKLLELQRHAMLMYTSCGWFFDELSGIETVQVIQYAGRALQLATDVFADPTLEPAFLARLAEAKSNIPDHQDGAGIYAKLVKPAIVDLPKLAAHYAIRSVFEEYGEHAKIYSYAVDREDYGRAETGKMRLVTGRARFTSRITHESSALAFGVLHFGDHNLTGGVREFTDDEEYKTVSDSLHGAFSRADTSEVLHLLDQSFNQNIYSLKSLFRDDQRKILDIVLGSTLAQAENSLRQQYEQHAPLMRFLADLQGEQPKLFRTLAQFALNSELREALQKDEIIPERVEHLLKEAATMRVAIDAPTLEFIVRKQTEQRAYAFWNNPMELAGLERLGAAVRLAKGMPFKVSLWTVQNLCAQRLNGTLSSMRALAAQGSESAQTWVNHMSSLADTLGLRVS